MGRKTKKIEHLEKQKTRKRKQIIAGISIFAFIAVIAIIVLFVNRNGEKAVYRPGSVKQETVRLASESNGDLHIPLEILTARLNFVSFGIDEDLLVWKDGNGIIRTAFDTCEECFLRGQVHFTLNGNNLICSACGTPQPLALLGTDVWSGCRPVSIIPEYRLDTDTEIIIPGRLLRYAGEMFTLWKTGNFSVSLSSYNP